MIATNDLIQKRTKAWTFYLHSLLDMLDKNTNLLDEKLKKGTTFSIAFEDFRNLLFSFRKFRDAFYSMVEETKQDKDFSQDTIFLKEYKRLYEEYNNYMDRLKNFSDDLRVEFNLELSEDLIEHLKDLNELYKTK
jgi:tRNA G10  N-methylase Trm11